MDSPTTVSPYKLPNEGEGRIGFLGITATGREGSRQNTGNFLHGFAARYIVGANRSLNKNAISEEVAEKLRDEITHVAFVAATTLPFKDTGATAEGFTKLADNIEKLKLPLIVFGLGVQAGMDSRIADAVAGPETKRLLSVMSHHTPVIGVRGEFTADLCRHFGIHNVEVVGCQSCFLSCSPHFSMSALAGRPEISKTVLNVTHYAPEISIIQEALTGGATFIGQSAHFEYALKKIPETIALEDLPQEVIEIASPGLLQAFRARKLDYHTYRKWIESHLFQYYSMEPWFAKLRSGFEASVGTRFHGNMAAMQMGVPSLWIAHDSRTKEFCNYLGLPNAPIASVKAGRPIADLFEEHYETGTFAKKYKENYRRFYDYLNLQGVDHRMAAPL